MNGSKISIHITHPFVFFARNLLRKRLRTVRARGVKTEDGHILPSKWVQIYFWIYFYFLFNILLSLLGPTNGYRFTPGGDFFFFLLGIQIVFIYRFISTMIGSLFIMYALSDTREILRLEYQIIVSGYLAFVPKRIR